MLPLEIVLHIAKNDINIWKACASIESEYHDFFNTETSKKMYHDIFVKVRTFGGRTEYTVNGKLHRDYDLPATIWNDGDQEWWIEGKLHRDEGKPAVIDTDGHREWRIHGKLIREVG